PPPLPTAELQKEVNAAAAAPPPSGPVTTRQYYNQLTSPAHCQACHSHINTLGFAFEGYDAIGAWRDHENGIAVDSSGELTIDGAAMKVASGVEVARALAKSPQVHACIATQWFRFAYGRGESEADAPIIEALGKQLAQPASGVLDLVAALAQTD